MTSKTISNKKNIIKDISSKLKKPFVKNEDQKILVVVVDRDNDIGVKLNVSGPVIGYKNNLKVATNFAITDPEDSDVNCMFAAIQKYKELSKDFDVEVVTLSGHSKDNLFFADKNIVEQLQKVLQLYPATSCVFVSDGAEDDQVMPIIQNYIPIISKRTVIVKQARGLENTFYIIKKAINDPFFKKVIFGVPAIILLLFVFLKHYAFQIIGLLFGLYFLIKGFNLEKNFTKFFKNTFTQISIYKISFPFYLSALFFIIFSIIKIINLYLINFEFSLLFRIVYVTRAVLLYVILFILSLVIARMIDSIYEKKLYLLGKYIFSIFATLIFAILLDLALQLLISKITVKLFIIITLISIVVLLLINVFTRMFDISTKITKLLVGLPVFSRYGLFLGEVVHVDEKRKTIQYIDRTTGSKKTISKKIFKLTNGRIII